MYDDLYEYFVLRGQLILPGIGTFKMEKKPAESDFANRVIQPPSYQVVFQHSTATPSKSFFNWLSEKMSISYSEAIVGFNAFVYDLKSEILSGGKIVWPRMGHFTKGQGNEIIVDELKQGFQLETPVSAVKVIRDKAEHSIRVGEDQRTSSEMEEILHKNNSIARRWWIWPVIIGGICLTLLVIHFSLKGIQSGNSSRISPAGNSPVERVLQ
jgi:hypothetical protein